MTEQEKRWASLRMSNGRPLIRHPIVVMVKNLTAQRIGIGDHSALGIARSEKEYRNRGISAFFCEMGMAIMTVEEMTAFLREANGEAAISKNELTDSFNKIRAIKDVLIPDLVEITKKIRDSRMTTEREMNQTLVWLKTVREFFLEKEYAIEMERIRDFVSICKEVQALKDAGTLDAMADLAIKLAIKEPTK